jgi:hypothetical protein
MVSAQVATEDENNILMTYTTILFPADHSFDPMPQQSRADNSLLPKKMHDTQLFQSLSSKGQRHPDVRKGRIAANVA